MVKWLVEEGNNDCVIYTERNEKQIPQDWENNLLLPIHKKGNQTLCKYYRPICLTQNSFNIYKRIIDNNLKK